jgi:hypothetical protein
MTMMTMMTVMTTMTAATRGKTGRFRLPRAYGAEQSGTPLEPFIYFRSLRRMCIEAEMSWDPKVHELALRVIARQSESVRELLTRLEVDGEYPTVKVAERPFSAR